jgi:PAS domain S-box-containing protein
MWRSGLGARRDFFNEGWLRFTGRSLEQETGQGWTHGVHPEDLRRFAALFLEPLRRLAPYEVEYRLRRHDGRYRWILERGVPVRGENAVQGFVGACFDIQERREGEESREAALRMMAHELRTPLQAVKMQLEVMRREAAAGVVSGPELFERLEAPLDRFGRLIGDLSQIGDPNGTGIERSRLDLATLLRGVVQTRSGRLRDVPGGSRHRLTFHGPAHAGIEGDSRRLKQVFQNLLDNSLKFSPRGGAVRVALESGPTMHRITVRDEGVGIPAHDVPLVSRRFFRASNASRDQFPGLGLGLAAARGIVEKHGGALSIASQVGRGTEVTVLLPQPPGDSP